jgi:hypothetical protein
VIPSVKKTNAYRILARKPLGKEKFGGKRT